MSERGSFVTDYVYCDLCFAVVKERLFRDFDAKYMNARQLEPFSIVAGKIGGLYPNEELDSMEALLHGLEDALCAGHEVRIAVLAEEDARIFTLVGRKVV